MSSILNYFGKKLGGTGTSSSTNPDSNAGGNANEKLESTVSTPTQSKYGN